MSEFIEENKTKLIVAGVLIAVVIVLTIVNSVINSNKVDYKAKLKALAINYYENMYYPALDKNYQELKNELLEEYSKTGLKVSLATLLEKNEGFSAEEFATGNIKKTYSTKMSYATIYPEAPYGRNDYRIDVKLVYDEMTINIEVNE